MRLKELLETASSGATGAGNIASLPMGGSSSKVGTLFGGSYGQKSPSKKKNKKPSESILKR